SQWGQDFRPDYRRIADFVDSLPQRPPVGAFTATATSRVREDIIRLLRLQSPVMSFTGFDRPNLYFEVIRPESRMDALMAILRDKQDESGIIYCATRKNVEEVCRKLQEEGFSAGRYHAGLSDEERRSAQEDFQYDRVQIMVATNAFGMGIDKSNVRFVIHYNMPRSMEAYYQEAGRAGRDGEAAECVMLFNRQDIVTARWMIDNSEPNPDMTPAEQQAVRRQDNARLQSMIAYCEESGCLRRVIRRYFGENAPERCGSCSSCCQPRYAEAAGLKKRPARRRAANQPEVVADGKTRLKLPKPGETSLFEQLRACRLQLAKEQHVPPYIVCDDKTLNDMVRRRPVTMEGLLTVHGMGAVKAGRYGEAFLRVIRDYDKTRTTITLTQNAPEKPVTPTVQVLPRPMADKPSPTPPPVQPVDKPSRQADNAAPLTPSEQAQLRWHYFMGVPIAQMAADMGRTEAAVRNILREMGLIV
ncbi:MAG: RecQ family ATP-dependent DNA helicase, partial [Aristaeellaceae bacterium]